MILFSHRPKLGVSVAATSVDGRLRVAVAQTHSRLDSFSRSRARQILTGRLQSEESSSVVYDSNISVHDFMNAFKDWFKPTPDESDEVFPKKLHKRRDKVYEMIVNKATQIVTGAIV